VRLTRTTDCWWDFHHRNDYRQTASRPSMASCEAPPQLHRLYARSRSVLSPARRTWQLRHTSTKSLDVRHNYPVICIAGCCILRLSFQHYCTAPSYAHFQSYRWKAGCSSSQFQRRLLGISWKDKVRNEDIRKKTGLRKLEVIIKERRPRWLGHVLLRMEDSRIPRHAIQWELRGYKRKPGLPRKNWMDIVRGDLKDMGTTRDEAEELATSTYLWQQTNRAEWRQHVAQSASIWNGCGMN